MLSTWANDTVTVLRAPLEESRGGTVRNWKRAVGHPVPGCSIQATSTSTGDRPGRTDNTEARADLYLPPGSDIKPGDRVVFDGVTYKLDGAPLAQRSPFGGCDHVIAHLVCWEG